MAKKVRIVERTKVSGKKVYVIQMKHYIYWFWWVDASMNLFDRNCIFDTFEDALLNVRYFDGTKDKDIVIYTNEHQ